ncbi:hypothetical protein O6H91_03G095500 [Diphasiastrum complanatum]|nr:hypothetical protein O6H91_03G095500 [Diphasiastrum complanatum]
MLQLLRRSRSILACNWRCQLATMNASKSLGTVHGSFVRYALIGGQPCVWLGQQDHQHDLNLLMDDRMSLILGHSDPVPLIRTLKIIGSAPPHLLLFGRLDPVADLDLAKLKKGLKDVSVSVELATDGASHVLRQILKESGRCVDRWAEAYAEATAPENDFSWYRVLAKSCYYVDSTGMRHKLELSDIMDSDASSSDALSPLLAAIIEGVNQSEQRRLALMALCVIHQRVRAQDAIMASADRWGFTVLAKVSDNTSNEKNFATETAEASLTKTRWKELRFSFDHEVRDADSFCFLLSELERETLRFLQ